MDMRLTYFILSALATLVLAAPARTQQSERLVGLSVGYANARVEGMSVTFSYAHVLGFIRPVGYIEGIAYTDPNSTFSRDDIGGGQSRCRNSNGQFADDASCAASWDVAMRAEGLFRLLRSKVLFGPGVRIAAGDVTPYGTAMYESRLSSGSTSVLQVKGSGGPRFIQAEVGVALSFYYSGR
jgi:hypothetical protein